MNMISFANIAGFDKQTGFFPEAETTEKTPDFSTILTNIFAALQTRDLPAKNASPNQPDGDVNAALAADPKQVLAVPNDRDENNLLELKNFQTAPALPAAQTLWAGTQAIRQRMNGYKSELKSDQKSNLQPAGLFQADPVPKSDKPGIILTCETSATPSAQQDQKPVDLTVLPQFLQPPPDSLIESNQRGELRSFADQNNSPSDFDPEPNPLNIVLKPKFVDNKIGGFDLSPNEINSLLGKFDSFLAHSATETDRVESSRHFSEAEADLFNSKLNNLQNLWWNDQINRDKNAKTGSGYFNPEIKENDFEIDLPVKFDNLFGAVSTDRKPVETVQNIQAQTVELAEQISPHLLELAALTVRKNEKQTLRLRLNPAELGTVEIKLVRNNAGILNAYFQTETEGARAALTNNLEQLRDSLQNAGWQIGQMEITSGSFSSTADQHRENSSRSSDSAVNYNFSRSSDQPGDLEQHSSNRLLSLLA